MAISYEDNDIVINGFERGIADDPYEGISNLINANLISVPKEASVNFSTSAISAPNVTGTVTSADAGADTVALSPNTMPSGQAIVFAGGSLPGGIVAGTTYWLGNQIGGSYPLYTTNDRSGAVLNITSSGTGTFATTVMGQPKYFTHLATTFTDSYFMVDSNGLVWSNLFTTTGAVGDPYYWTYTGNTTLTNAHGNGLIAYVPSNSYSSAIGYIFVFRDTAIDYATITSNTTLVWTYGWAPAGITVTTNFLSNSHETFLAPDNVVYFCNGSYIGRWFENTGKNFLPTDATTYISDQTRLLPFNDTAQCLSFLGTSLMIGGHNNVIYPWDTTSPTFSYPILLSEYNIVKLVTVNTNMFIFVGNRGRIYYTNGTNAQLYKKIPDHISGTIEPYFTWGGACSNKNQLYFSALVKTNGGTAITTYGGLWGIDLDTKGIRLTNTLSYQTTVYNGYATALIPNFATAPAGTGLYIGWDSNSSTYGIDTTSGSPYTGGTAVAKTIIDSDLIPIGTFLKPTSNGRVEFKLAMPLATNESVQLFYRQKFSDDFTTHPVGNAITTATQGFNGYSWAYTSVNFQNSQWLQIRAVLISTASSPSYCRLTEIRVGIN